MQTNLWTLSDKIFSLSYLQTEQARSVPKRGKISEKAEKTDRKRKKNPVPASVKNRKNKMFTSVHSISDKYGHSHTAAPW